MKIDHALTFDDVLMVPGYSEVLPAEVSVKTQLTPSIHLNAPLLSAAMDTVTESRLAIAIAEQGGLGVLHKNMSPEDQAQEVIKVKKYESGVVKDPVTVSPNSSLAELKTLSLTYQFSGMPVVDGDDLIGIITNRDIRFETDLTQPVSQFMTPKERLITVSEQASHQEIIDLFRQHRVEKILMVNDHFHLKGMYTVRDILKTRENPLASKNAMGQLRVAAAVGTSEECLDRIERLVVAGVDMIVIDTAHGHSCGVIERVKWARQQYPDLQIMAGNVATADAALALADAGANAVKVGIGPGSICITRVVAGVGVPQISAIQSVAQALRDRPVSLIADGGIRFSGDVAKAIAAGAHAVMMGGMFAGTEEAPGDVVLYQGRSYKSYRGMGSIGAMSGQNGSSDRYFQTHINKSQKYVPEGVEGRVPYKGPLKDVVHQLVGGLCSSMGYTGNKTIDDMRLNTQFVRITHAGMRESHVHDVSITRETPNYSIEE
jgi:IMP dehydrogenase